MTKPWKKIIADARKRKYFTGTERRRASLWPSCACGQLDKRIPRLSGAAPIDNRLYKLGISFSMAVDTNDFRMAESSSSKLLSAPPCS